MNDLNYFGRLLILFGVTIVGVGLLLTFIGRIPYLGRLPGDIYIQKKNFSFYFPLATSILLSIVISAILYILHRR